MIDYTDAGLRDGISGGAEISGGNMTVQESKDLAFVLNTGALPVKLEPDVPAAGLGHARQGLAEPGLSSPASIGLGLVLIYMLLYYRFLGLVADLALIVYGILLWGLFNAIPVTLTLPGIAGMILTIGVAADANVVIFERIKEEVRHGKTVRSRRQLRLRARLQDHPRRQHPHHAHGGRDLRVRHGLSPRASPSRSSSACSSACSPPCCSRAPCSACWPASPSSASRPSWACRPARSRPPAEPDDRRAAPPPPRAPRRRRGGGDGGVPAAEAPPRRTGARATGSQVAGASPAAGTSTSRKKKKRR